MSKISFQRLLPTKRGWQRPLGEGDSWSLVTSKKQPEATSSPGPLPSRVPFQVDLLGQGPRVDESPRLQDGRHSLWPLAAAELQQEGVDEVWEEVQELIVLVHLLDEKVDGA